MGLIRQIYHSLPRGLRACSLVLMLCACQQPEPASRLEVVGGAALDPSSPAWTSMVGLVRPNRSGYEVFCSGTLIAPDLVITAAHCLAGINSIVPVSVLFDRSASEGGSSPVLIDVQATRTFQKNPERFYPNFDLAWLKLERPAPREYKPAEILRDPRSLDPLIELNDGVLLGGYGKTSSTCEKDEPGCTGQAREVRTRLRRYVETPHFRKLLVVGPKPGFGSCNGDSGGPLYAMHQGRWFLVGVLHGKSAVLNSNAVSQTDRICESGESVYTFPGAYSDWVQESTGRTLSFDEALNPPGAFASGPQTLPERPSLADYLRFDDIGQELWYTAEVLLAGFKEPDKRLEADFDRLVTDPERAAAAMSQWESFAANGGGTGNASMLMARDQQMSDVRPLALLTRLKRLELIGQKIRDTQALGTLTQLEELTLSNNFDLKNQERIPWDLRFLGKLPRLRVLNLFTNGESLDLRQVPWDQLTQLETLILSNNAGILDFNLIPWPALPRLKQLVVMNSDIRDIRPLAAAKGLEQLNLRRNLIRDISVLEQLPGLRILDLSQNQIENFTPIQKLGRLEALFALDNPTQEAICPEGAKCIYNPEGLASFGAYCRFAQELKEEDRSLWKGTRTVIRMLRETSQNLSLDKVDCARASWELEQRTSLNLSGLGSNMDVSDLNPLRPLRNLQRLDLDYNQVSDVRPLGELSGLQYLNLNGNRIAQAYPLASLPNLKVLRLDSNLIRDMQQFAKFREVELSLLRNFISNRFCPIAGGICHFDEGSLAGPTL